MPDRENGRSDSCRTERRGWPREEASAGFLREEEIQGLNQRVRFFLNKRALKQGAQEKGIGTGA